MNTGLVRRLVRHLLACGLFIWLGWAGSAYAIDCTVTMSDIEFGDVNVLTTTPVSVNGEVKVECTDMTTKFARVCLSFGSPGGGTVANRTMTGATSTPLAYNLYQNASHTTPWGSVYFTPPQSRSVTLQADSFGMATATVMYYGYMLLPQATVPAGSYTAIYTTADTNMNVQGYVSTPPACSMSMPQGTSWTFTVRATVVSDCNITATNIDFGQIGLISGPVSANGNISVTCTAGTAYSLTLNNGTGAGATPTARKMTRDGGTETLTYGLYIDATHNIAWGDGTGGATVLMGTGNGLTNQNTVYGQVPPQAGAAPGLYRDTIIVTITY
jgi:spore coat protein U-like protein